ncbi:MAG TPA: sulfotransferase [Chthoniobacterales bacterium]|nr:sulfotransferase [Chthoniobacterales bacterium]
MRPPVLIIGAHRSGTSATAHALEILGLQIGHRLDSHYEPKPLTLVHENYLETVGASWHDPGPFLESIRSPEGERRCAEYLRHNIDRNFSRIFGYRKNPRGLWRLCRLKFGAAWGWKEPRTTLFASAWLQIFPDARLLQIVRDPVAAASSIRVRELKFQAGGDLPTGKTDDLGYCIRLVQIYREAGERFAGRENYLRIAFEDVQNKPTEILGQTAQFCGLKFTSAQLARAAATIRPLGARLATS